MYNNESIRRLISFVYSYDGVLDKDHLRDAVVNEFSLEKRGRAIYFCDDYALVFIKAESAISFSNVVISLKQIKNFDQRPFFAVVVSPTTNRLYLMNAYLIDKVEHSSYALTMTHISGSILGGNIYREVDGITNTEENFQILFEKHLESGGFEGNLQRIITKTSEIVPIKKKYEITDEVMPIIQSSVERAASFSQSAEYSSLLALLQSRVDERHDFLVKAAKLTANVNIRGRLIEYIITGSNADPVWVQTMNCLTNGRKLPKFTTRDDLGDFEMNSTNFNIKLDIKSEMLNKSAAPKGYNVDKILRFLSTEKSVFLLFFVGIDPSLENPDINCALTTMFDDKLIATTGVQRHWSSKNGRGATQFSSKTIKEILDTKNNEVNEQNSREFLNKLINEEFFT